MRKIGLAILLALASACSSQGDVPTATAAADGFHRQFNARDDTAIYQNSDRLLKTSMPAKAFAELLENVRKSLGDFKSADTPGWSEQTNANGQFVTLIYHSKFERAEADETLVFRLDGGRATLISYHVTAQGQAPN